MNHESAYPISKTEPLVESVEETPTLLEDPYEKELLSMIEAFKPQDAGEEYEEALLQELYDDVKKINLAQGLMIDNPETLNQEMLDVFRSRVKAVTEDARDYTRKERPTGELLHHAKIALLAEGDYSDFEKYFGEGSHKRERVTLRDIERYVNEKLTTHDIDMLMKSSLSESILKTPSYEYDESLIEAMPESMLIALADREKRGNHSSEIKLGLESSDKAFYTSSAADTLLDARYEEMVLKYYDKFESVDTNKLVRSGELFTHDILQTLSAVKKISDESLRTEIVTKGAIKYLSAGKGFTYYLQAKEGLGFSDAVERSPELQEAAYKGVLAAMTNRQNRFDEIMDIIRDFEIPEQQLYSPEAKEAVETYLKKEILNNYGDEMRTINQISSVFNISQEKINEIAASVAPERIAKSSINGVLDFLQKYNIPESVIHTSETQEVILKTLNDAAGNFNMQEVARLIENFPLLKERYSNNASPMDIIFETFITKAQQEDGSENKEDKISRLKNIQESFWVTSNKDRLPQQILEKAESFNEKYGKKGLALVALAIAGEGLERPDSLEKKLSSIESVLDRYNPENIPRGAHVSMGIEYEVTSSLASQYNKDSVLGYKKDIELISEAANIGKGLGGVHEIAVRPTYNPYMLLAEMRLMQEADLLDLNFERYEQAPRGYHLSLVGDTGLYVNEDMHFLHNLMTMAELTGALAGKELKSAKTVHAKNFDAFSDTTQNGYRCELKGMGTDTVEQFEKSIITAHHAGIAMQLSNKYLELKVGPIIAIGSNPTEFESIIQMQGMLKVPFESNQERDMLFAWMSLKNNIVESINQHNQSFVDGEFNGYVLRANGEYVDTSEHIDVMRNKKLIEKDTLDSQLFKKSIHMKVSDLFFQQDPEFVNALIKTNNIFLKPPQVTEDGTINQSDVKAEAYSTVNARAMLDVVKAEGYGELQSGSPTESVFDRGGTLREGYYVVQGASEEMITHKSQILLNRFNKQMETLLETPGVLRRREEVQLA